MDDKQLHLIYKRSQVDSLFNNTNCGTKGTFKEAMNERLQWENMYGQAVENSVRNSIFDHLVTRETNRQLEYVPRKIRQRRNCVTCDEENTELCECPPTDPMCLSKTPLYLEMMVTVDFRIDRTWADVDVESYVFSIMNMVASNLEDGSIGNPIKLKIVRIILLTYAYPQLDILRFSPMKLLNNFCQWQMNFNPNTEYHPNHHDFAVFITRFEPCQGHILGVTNMASICRPDKSCAVVSDEGLLLANIITHQIGHSLGADHDDGSSGGCASVEPDGTAYHMGPMMSMSSSEWSVCSKHCITDFVSTHVSWCLSDLPSLHDFIKPNILPGQIYSPIQQCSINFNMKTMACRIGDFCKMLYCQISPTQCASTGDPPAEGTPCAMNMWCFHGDCVQRGSRPGAVNGEWGPWSHWAQCSRSCGGGVQIRHRSCNDPAPRYGGRYCKGDFISFKMCSIMPCVGFNQGFAQLQCKLTENRLYNGIQHNWDHFQAFFEDVECALVCINERKQIAVRSPVVVDGTPCREGTRDVCVQGKCMKVGCDWVINSLSKEDACGVCHGNGTSCRIVQGYYAEANSSTGELQPFLKLPTGTSMIFIRETSPSHCVVVVTSSMNSTFYLNNLRGEDTLPGLVNIAGAFGVYESKARVERLYIQGSIRGPIVVSLFCKDHNTRGIRYQYALPESDPFYLPQYSWEYVYWEKCQVPCGGGAQRAPAVCIESRSGEVDDKYCSSITKPDDVIRVCNQFPCTARWWVGPWSDCDCTGEEGIQTRLVLCMRMQTLDALNSKVVKEKECCRQPKPRLERPCSPTAEFQDVPSTELGITSTSMMARGKRQMKEISLTNEENFMTESVNKNALSSATFSPLIAEVRSKNFKNDKFRVPELSRVYGKEENRITKGKEYDNPIVRLSKALNKKAEENLERRRKKLLSNVRSRARPNMQGLTLHDVIPTSLSQHKPVHRQKLYNAIMEMANKLDKGNSEPYKRAGEKVVKEGALAALHDVKRGTARSQVLNRISNKQVRPPILGIKNPGGLANNTVLVLRPVSDETTVTNTECATVSADKVRSTTAVITTVGKNLVTTGATSRGTTQNSSWCPLRQLTKIPIEKSTNCDLQRATDFEPADMPGWLETANASSYKLVIAPIEPVLLGYPETDAEFQILGRAGSWPVGDVKNEIVISGDQVLEALLEGKRRMTKPPVIRTDE
ncbi:A disintegrin and metalloproteinase with thrombospondin motifs 7-like isoform X3 [Rhodnius prolixus]